MLNFYIHNLTAIHDSYIWLLQIIDTKPVLLIDNEMHNFQMLP